MKKNSLELGLKVPVLVISLMVTACGGGGRVIPKHQIVKRAPSSEKETGVIVSGVSENDLAQVAVDHPELKFRPVSRPHNLFEIFGATTSEIKNIINNPNATIEKNHYVKLKTMGLIPIAVEPKIEKHPYVTVIEDNLEIRLGGQVESFISSCHIDSKLNPKLNLIDNQGRDRLGAGIFFEQGQTLVLDASQSQAVGPMTEPKLEFLWIVKAPDYSQMGVKAMITDQLNYTPDETGLHIFSVVAKDTRGYCSIDLQGFYVTANDPYSPESPMPDSDSTPIDESTFWHVIHVGAQKVWKQASGMGLTVGVIDSGVDYNHPALSANMLVNTNEIPDNGIDDDGNGFVDDVVGYDFGSDDGSPFDDYGHGTHVAGIAASHVFGAARKSHILPTKFGSGMGFDYASVTGAIKYSVDRGAKVLNMSFGWEEDLAVVREAMDYAEKHDVLVVAAAGNDSADNDKVASFPCNYPNKNILSIAATDENDKLTFYSNYGQKVHLAAPGGTPEKKIISSYKKNAQGEQYVGLMGTSMASPLVAGVAAEIWSANPNLNAEQIRQILMDTGKPSLDLSGKILSGKVVDAEAALARVLTTRPESSLLP